MCPSVRATFGSFSGPMTISATTAMRTISEKPTSNMDAAKVAPPRSRQAYCVFSFFASPSIVWPEGNCCDGGLCASSSEPFIPSLNPFTAPPRSLPMLRSFAVPKISTTTSSTISQCQMLSPPMFLLLSCAPGHHPPERLRTAEHVHVQMLHFLPPDAPGIDDRPVAVGRALLAREAPRERENPSQNLGILQRRVRERSDMALRNHHEMHRRLRVDVLEGEDILVLVDLL